MVINIEDSVLVVVDVQGKLAGLVHDHDVLYHNIERLIKITKILKIPIIWTEQAPEKIGPTVDSIHDLLFPMIKPIPKKSFSCWNSEEFVKHLASTHHREIILTGIETHVCIYQTARDLHAHGYQVQVVADAVSSRNPVDRDIAIARMRQENMTVTVGESVICELLKSADHPQFKDVMTYIK